MFVRTAAVLTAAGCGNDEEDANARRQPSLANESPQTFAERLAKLLGTTKAKRDCGEIAAINARSAANFVCPQT